MLDAIAAVRLDRAALLDIGAELTESQWHASSGCAGWSVLDVVTHLSNLFLAVVDPAKLPDTAGLPLEGAQEAGVQARRGLSPDEALAEYEQVSKLGLDKLAEIGALDLEVPLGDGGTYPAFVLPSAYAFDHYIHIRADLFGPRGPLDGEPPPSDELRAGSALDWIEAALPQQNQAAAAASRLKIEITGTGARVIDFGTGEPKATVSSDAPAFIRWVTQRGSWPELGVDAAGDEAALAAARSLKVF